MIHVGTRSGCSPRAALRKMSRLVDDVFAEGIMSESSHHLIRTSDSGMATVDSRRQTPCKSSRWATTLLVGFILSGLQALLSFLVLTGDGPPSQALDQALRPWRPRIDPQGRDVQAEVPGLLPQFRVSRAPRACLWLRRRSSHAHRPEVVSVPCRAGAAPPRCLSEIATTRSPNFAIRAAPEATTLPARQCSRAKYEYPARVSILQRL